MHTAQLEMQQAANRLGAAQRRLKKARAEHLRRAGKRPPPNPSRAMEFDDKVEETQESAAAWKKRMGDWNVRMRLYYELNREAEWELEDARHEEHEASIEAHEADDWYQKSLEWRRSSGRRVAEYETVLREGHDRRAREVESVLEEAREAAGGMAWTP